MIESHPTFEQPLDLEVHVWRYMDLAKFVRLLQSQALFFARADTFDDRLEGANTFAAAQYFEWIVKPENEDYRGKAFPGVSLDMLRHYSTTLPDARRERRAHTFISCWHAAYEESAAMWGLYGSSGGSIAIRTSYKKLAAALPTGVFMGRVKYVDYHKHIFDQGNLFVPFIHKRLSFRHEDEVRAVIDDEIYAAHSPTTLDFQKTGVDVPIDLGIIDLVYVSPLAPGWFHRVVGGLTGNYGLKAPVVQSELARDPVY